MPMKIKISVNKFKHRRDGAHRCFKTFGYGMVIPVKQQPFLSITEWGPM